MLKSTFAIYAALLMSGVTLAEESTISLIGQGVIQAEPDEGYITVGVVNVAADSAQAVKDNTVTMTVLYATLEEQGVTRQNIKTINFSISENWKEKVVENNRQVRVRDGFRVVNMVQVTVCELDSFGKVLDALVSNGANSIQGISFGSSKASELRDQARVLAVKDALRRAELLAKPLGVTIGDVVSISESMQYGQRNVYAVAASLSDASEVPVSGGTLSFTASVNITWELNDSKGERRTKPLPIGTLR